jgi:methionine salvage enolase-phosphatase E1
VAPGEAVFFSDVVKELDAARAAGMETRLVVREGNAAVEDARGHLILASLAAI